MVVKANKAGIDTSQGTTFSDELEIFMLRCQGPNPNRDRLGFNGRLPPSSFTALESPNLEHYKWVVELAPCSYNEKSKLYG